LIYSVFDEESDACGTWIAQKRSVFSTSGVLADYIMVSKLQLFLFFYHKYGALQWGNTGLYFPFSLTL
jgi:hypothetical protein